MSQKAEKPTLSGQRIKTRKRDEKEKYDPIAFRDAVLQGIIEANNDLELLSKFLDSAGSRLNYRRYAEPLFDVLFAGGILAPGGSVLEDSEVDKPYCTEFCIFHADKDLKAIKAYYEVLYKLIRRYKYLEKSFEDELKKLIVFLKGFGEEERHKLAMITALCLANGLGNPTCLGALFEDHLVKEGLALQFATHLFTAWTQEKDIQNVAAALKRGGFETKLSNLLPINKRTQENFEDHFRAAGLQQIVEYQRAKASSEVKKALQKTLEDMIRDEMPVKEIVAAVSDQFEKTNMQEYEIVVMTWNTIMASMEWTKKEELVTEQALKYLRLYAPLLASLTKSGRAELILVQRVQDYCYENMNFIKTFQKIIVLLYKLDVIGEDVILKWYKESHTSKGKSIFLEQMKSFVEWLQNAEEESEEEDED